MGEKSDVPLKLRDRIALRVPEAAAMVGLSEGAFRELSACGVALGDRSACGVALATRTLRL